VPEEPQRSSPIASRSEDEQVIEDSWTWKIATIRNEQKKRVCTMAKATYEENMEIID
jgi:hypothetical protein